MGTTVRRALVTALLAAVAAASTRAVPDLPGDTPAPPLAPGPGLGPGPTVAAPTTTTTTLPPAFPLTGRPAPDHAAVARAAVTVKIDNAPQARPQAGIEHADVIYEELTEGITRLVAVFHSTDVEVLGPVRSVRPADPAIVTPLGGVLAFSGGSPPADALARASPLTIVTEADTEAMYRRPGRGAPFNLYTSTAALRSRAPAGTPPPPPLAPFLPAGAAFSGPDSAPAGQIRLVPAPFLTAAYDWDPAAGVWRRFTDGLPHLLESGLQVSPTTVILQFAPYVTFIPDPIVTYPEVVGTGEAWVLTGGVVVRGTWSKPSPTEPTVYAGPAGEPLALPQGQTWVHLLAPGAPVEVVQP
jgi:hypothetical protein